MEYTSKISNKTFVGYVLFSALIFGFFQLSAQTGPNSPSTFNSAGAGSVWTSVSNVGASDDVYATATPDEENTRRVRVTDFGFAITDGDEIEGIEVTVEWAADNADRIFEKQIKLRKGTSLVGTNNSSNAVITTTETITTYGGATELWGETWLESDIESANFGVQVKAKETGDGTNTISIDHITITIYHSTPSGATVFVSNGSGGGDWNVGSTWDQTGCTSGCVAGTDYPSSTEDAEILGGDNVTITSGFSAEALDVTLNSDYSTTEASTLSFGNSSSSLAVGDDFESLASTLQITGAIHTVNLNGGSITIADNLILTADNNASKRCEVDFNIEGGTVTVANDIYLGSDNNNADAEIDLSTSNSKLILGGNFFESGTADRGQLLTIGTDCTVEYNGSGAQTVVTAVGNTAVAYDNLTLSTGGTKTIDADATINDDLSIANGVTLASGNFDITIGGNWLNNETTASAGFTEGTGTVTFNGSDAQTISHAGGVETFNDLTINNSSGGVAMSDGINLIATLTLTSGVLTTTGQAFTVVADASGTARIGEITGGSITGNITMQTYYPLSTEGYLVGWHELSSCIVGGSVSDWHDDFETCGYSGAQYTSAECGGFASTGYYFDESLDGGESSGGWQVITSSKSTLGQGISMWVSANDITLDVTGVPQTGSITCNSGSNPKLSYTSNHADPDEDGWNLLGNPFPSAIDWDLIDGGDKIGIDDIIYIFNNSTGSYGSYTGGMGGAGQGGVNNILPASQAFWIHATASPSLVIKEEDKVDDDQAILKSKTTFKYLKLKLEGDVNSYSDDVLLFFDEDGSSNFIESKDALKMYSFISDAHSINTVCSDNEDVSIKTLPDYGANIVVPLRIKVGGGASGIYNLNVTDMVNIPDSMDIILLDSLTGDITDLRKTPNYSFSISDTTNAPRIYLKFSLDPLLTKLEENNNDAIKLYPNPSRAPVFIEGEEIDHDANFEVYDILGKKMASKKTRVGENRSRIDINAKSGVYFVKFRKGNQLVSRRINILK
ncbi:MAG: T9SS type A sorting domain-containing protein [Flavobacteriales bacterium]|nr:T9SS type A sorting domain-containing protein [Flavobacteriales bacterium]